VPERAYGAAAPATTSTVRPEDWDGAPLTGRRFDAVLFAGVDLAEQDERGAVFSDCTFRSVRFNVSTHVDAAFLNCTFVDCSFFDVTFTNCKFVGSMFDRCRFGPTTIEGGDWSLVGLPGADLREVAFRKLAMREADLTGARLDGTIVRDVDLAGAWLHRLSCEGTDLRGSDLTALDPLNVDLAGALIDPEQALVIATALGLRIG
jgi:uncharacterized protein YjbI with pentapeptide repeats